MALRITSRDLGNLCRVHFDLKNFICTLDHVVHLPSQRTGESAETIDRVERKTSSAEIFEPADCIVFVDELEEASSLMSAYTYEHMQRAEAITKQTHGPPLPFYCISSGDTSGGGSPFSRCPSDEVQTRLWHSSFGYLIGYLDNLPLPLRRQQVFDLVLLDFRNTESSSFTTSSPRPFELPQVIRSTCLERLPGCRQVPHGIQHTPTAFPMCESGHP